MAAKKVSVLQIYKTTVCKNAGCGQSEGKTIAKFAKNRIRQGSIVHMDAYCSCRKPLAEKHLLKVFNPDSEITNIERKTW